MVERRLCVLRECLTGMNWRYTGLVVDRRCTRHQLLHDIIVT